MACAIDSSLHLITQDRFRGYVISLEILRFPSCHVMHYLNATQRNRHRDLLMFSRHLGLMIPGSVRENKMVGRIRKPVCKPGSQHLKQCKS